MQVQSEKEQEMAELIIETLNLEDMAAADIQPEEFLFGEGLGLDSIDALELALAITQKYSIQLKAEDENMKEVFSTLRNLTAYVEENSA